MKVGSKGKFDLFVYYIHHQTMRMVDPSLKENKIYNLMIRSDKICI